MANERSVGSGNPGMTELEITAATENLQQVQSFVERCLEESGCPLKAQMQIGIAVEEIFVNIAHYAYPSGEGCAVVRVEKTEEPCAVTITFIDSGIPYDPLAKDDPDVTLSAEDREIGGLGIFMTKQLMDDVEYAYRNGQNILKIRKDL